MNRLIHKQILGIIDATTYIESLEPIIRHRSVASIPFGGRYRLIDFMLSNMVHAGIDNIGVVSHYRHRSLKEHVGSGKTWDLDRKTGGLFFYVQPENEKVAAKTVAEDCLEFISESPQKYVVVASSNVVGSISFLDVLKAHIENEVDITELTYQEESLPIFMIEKDLLLELLTGFEAVSFSYETIMQYIFTSGRKLKTQAYEVKGLIMEIDSLVDYYRHSMELLCLDSWKQVFPKTNPVLTKAKDGPPTKYLPTSQVTNSMVANGCIIEGKVENSHVFRGVTIGKNTVIRNSIIMAKVTIGDNCILDGVIIDKDVTIESGTVLEATCKIPIVIPKGEYVGEEELVS